MSVRREEYLIIGCKGDEDFCERYWHMENFLNIDKQYGYEKTNENEVQILTDGMGGNYCFIGFIKQLSDGYDENEQITEITNITQEQIDAIQKKFQEIFPTESMLPIKIYHAPHFA